MLVVYYDSIYFLSLDGDIKKVMYYDWKGINITDDF